MKTLEERFDEKFWMIKPPNDCGITLYDSDFNSIKNFIQQELKAHKEEVRKAIEKMTEKQNKKVYHPLFNKGHRRTKEVKYKEIGWNNHIQECKKIANNLYKE